MKESYKNRWIVFLYLNGDVNDNEVYLALATAQTFKDADEKLKSDIALVLNDNIVNVVKEKMGKKFSIDNVKSDYSYFDDEYLGNETAALYANHLLEISYDKKVFFDLELELRFDRYSYDHININVGYFLLDKFRISDIHMKLKGYCIARTLNYTTRFHEGRLVSDTIKYDNLGKLIGKPISHYISEKKKTRRWQKQFVYL